MTSCHKGFGSRSLTLHVSETIAPTKTNWKDKQTTISVSSSYIINSTFALEEILDPNKNYGLVVLVMLVMMMKWIEVYFYISLYGLKLWKRENDLASHSTAMELYYLSTPHLSLSISSFFTYLGYSLLLNSNEDSSSVFFWTVLLLGPSPWHTHLMETV